MPTPPETLTHPVFGELRWEERGVWFAQVRDSSGEWLDVVINSGDGDRMAVIEPAAKLYRRALQSERRILRDAVRDELLELYNHTWRQGAEPELTAQQLIDQLQFTFIELQPGWDIPIILSYAADNLFGGHSVDVEVDDKLQVIDTDLIG